MDPVILLYIPNNFSICFDEHDKISAWTFVADNHQTEG